MAKQSNSGLQNISPFALLSVSAMIAIVFTLGFDLLGSENSVWPWLIVPVLAGVIAIPMLRKTKIEKYFEAIGVAHPDIKPPRKLKKEGDIYTFRMPLGMSKSQYEKYQEGLEQCLNSKVEFRFEHDLIIKVTDKPPEP